MKYLTALFSLLLVAGIAMADSFVAVSKTNWTPQALGFPHYDTNRVMTNVTWTTNMVPSYEFTNIITTINAVGKTASDAGFPLGEIITSLIGAVIIAFVKWQQLKQKKLSTVLGQNVETYSEILKAQPNGAILDSKAKYEIKSQQVTADVKKMAAEVAEEKVNIVEAREAADRVMAPPWTPAMSSPPPNQ